MRLQMTPARHARSVVHLRDVGSGTGSGWVVADQTGSVAQGGKEKRSGLEQSGGFAGAGFGDQAGTAGGPAIDAAAIVRGKEQAA